MSGRLKGSTRYVQAVVELGGGIEGPLVRTGPKDHLVPALGTSWVIRGGVAQSFGNYVATCGRLVNASDRMPSPFQGSLAPPSGPYATPMRANTRELSTTPEKPGGHVCAGQRPNQP